MTLERGLDEEGKQGSPLSQYSLGGGLFVVGENTPRPPCNFKRET